MPNANLDLLRSSDDTKSASSFAPFPEVLAPPAYRDYTQVPSYELPVFRNARKLAEVQGFTGLKVARRMPA